MRTDMKTILLAMFATACFNVGCDDDDDDNGAGGAGGGDDMGMTAGGAGGGEGGMGGGEGGMGGEGGGVEATCLTECARLADCSAASDSCAGIDAESRDAFYDGCLETCATTPALVQLAASQSECEGLISTLKTVNATYRETCEGGGEGGMGGEGGEGGMGGMGGEGGGGPDHFPEGEQIDRMGRAAITTALIGADDKDAYNADSDVAGWAAAWSDKLTAGLAAADTLDGVNGNTQLPPDALGPFLANDWLMVDTSKPFTDGGYLTVELALVGVIPEGTSGGRSLTQNVIDVTLSAVVGTGNEMGTAPDLSTNWDCVDANDVPFQDGFPYLAPPN